MAITYGFFNSTEEDERKYNAEEISSMFDGFIVDGVHEQLGGGLEVLPGDGNQVIVNSGRAWFNNSWLYNDSFYSIDITVSALNVTSVYIALYFDTENRVNSIIAVNIDDFVKGNNQYPLAKIDIPANNTQITDGMITDMRGSSLCPYASVMTNEYWEKIENLVQAGYYGDVSNMEAGTESSPLMVIPAIETINGENVQVLKLYKSDILKRRVTDDGTAVFNTINIGENNVVTGKDSIGIGNGVDAIGVSSFAHGLKRGDNYGMVRSSGNYSRAEGCGGDDETGGVQAVGNYSRAEGYGNIVASGIGSHAEGATDFITDDGKRDYNITIASGKGSHAEGCGTIASGDYSHAEGYANVDANTESSGKGSHAEGSGTNASGDYSHAEGVSTIASHAGSHAGGHGTQTGRIYQTVVGSYNHANGAAEFIVGIGTSNNDRKNGFIVNSSGVVGGGNNTYFRMTPDKNNGGNHGVIIPNSLRVSGATQFDLFQLLEGGTAIDYANILNALYMAVNTSTSWGDFQTKLNNAIDDLSHNRY